MKVKQKLEKAKGENVLRGPRVTKKMKPPPVSKVPLLKKKEIVKDLPKPRVPPKKTPKGRGIVTSKGNAKASKKVAVPKTIAKLDLSSQMVEQAVQVLLQLHDEHRQKSKTLLLNDKENVLLQVSWIKIPQVPEPRRQFVQLHHGLYGDEPEVCLFVADRKARDHVKRTPDELIEHSVDHYEQLLKTHKVEGITTIMPVHQLRTEYSGYELSRKLVDRFDVFLVQSSVMDNPSFLNNLGVAFTKKNKVPLCLRFPKEKSAPDGKMAERAAKLLRTSWFQLKPHGDTVAIRVGTLALTAEQLRENVVHVLSQLSGDASDDQGLVPGGVVNIKSIMLKTSRSKAIPLYINLASPSKVEVPVVPSLRPVQEAMEDELSTQPGQKVSVLPSGEVFVTNDSDQEMIPGWDSDEEDDNQLSAWQNDDVAEDKSSGDEDAPVEKQLKRKKDLPGKAKAKGKKQAVEEDVSEDSDMEAEKAEQQYLVSRSNQGEDSDEDSDAGEEDEKEVVVKKGKGKTPGKAGGKKVAAKSLGGGKKKNQEMSKTAMRRLSAGKQKNQEAKKAAVQKVGEERKTNLEALPPSVHGLFEARRKKLEAKDAFVQKMSEAKRKNQEANKTANANAKRQKASKK